MEILKMTFEMVKEAMINTLGCDEERITPEALLADDLNIDSLDAVELVMAIEDEIGTKIPDEELGKLKSVKDICDCVDKYRG